MRPWVVRSNGSHDCCWACQHAVKGLARLPKLVCNRSGRCTDAVGVKHGSREEHLNVKEARIAIGKMGLSFNTKLEGIFRRVRLQHAFLELVSAYPASTADAADHAWLSS